ncbi:GH36 C-terminal domain-containing protein [Bacillus sp. FJAT-28004]|uniref:GH36 C-terminal domain-containing protein n=1 Tax=Bacillus sp. FJAT-28004 TaxID=1679165 RepID=UPI0013793AAD|nr:GH36 C-terminal domain-containing protein [Bacillus sp. FJAT-28004]
MSARNLTSGAERESISLQGLAGGMVYDVEGLVKDTVQLHGSTLMNAGIPLNMRGDFDSVMIRNKIREGTHE